ncbi:MAG: endonuclease/exonuclease/phosphatase family protein [Treponema sp.]|nr:endonuclease/exonuclease/phosphatase family protein [Treponema sp.]
MKNCKKRTVLAAVFALAALLACSCKNPGQKRRSLKIVNWNAQTFFDGNKDGIEYPNFVKSKKWNQDAYKDRLQKLCKAIDILDGDLVILEEIENLGIIHDISNALAKNSWQQKKLYRYACFAKKPGASIGCAVLSRLPLQDLKVHSLDIQAENEPAPSMRPLIEVDLLAPKRLKIFVNHWKSKAGGSDSSVWRRWQESLLAQKILEAQETDSEAAILCAGDFNQDISEFCLSQEVQDGATVPKVELRSPFCGQKVLVRSPWLDYDSPIGSYNFRDKWERIDHFFCCGDLTLEDFGPQTGEWSYEDGRPKVFRIHSLMGWSDHLPIACRVEW